MSPRSPVRGAAIAVALASSTAFAMSGPFAKPLLDTGWSPAAAGLVRIGGSALVLLIPTLVVVWTSRGAGLVVHHRFLVAYGLFAVAGAQIGFFNAIRTLPVGVALLVEYMAPVLVVLWLWLRRGARPGLLTTAGAAVAVAGLVLVLDPFGDARIDLVGLAWAGWAAACVTVYFLLSARTADELPATLVVGAGMVVGAAALLLAAAVGLLPLTVSSATTTFGSLSLPWWLPAAGLVLVATVLAYLTGVLATRSLGSRLMSFLGLSEVLFAVLASWALLAQQPTLLQLAGGVLIVTGVVLVRLGEPVRTPDRDAHGASAVQQACPAS